MTHTHGKSQGQSSVSSKYRVETGGQTDGRLGEGNCITYCANVVSNTYANQLTMNTAFV